MEEITVGFRNAGQYIGQPFRVTYKERDYQVRILEKIPSKDNTEFKILIDGIVEKLVQQDKKWTFSGRGEDAILAHEIWRAISLRYRF